MTFGFKPDELEMITAAFREFPEIEEVIIFVSRAMGNFKPASDVDLAFKGRISRDVLTRTRMHLNEDLPLAYVFDVFDHTAITHKPLREHIARFGKLLYPVE